MTSIQQIQVIYDRRKSGYRRDFNPRDVFLFNVMGFALGLALSTNPAFIGGFAPSAYIPLVIFLGFILGLCNGLIYGWFGAIMPNTGGDFVFVTRSINHRIGFLTNWGFTICQLCGMAMNIGWILSMAISPSLISIGYSFGEPSLISFAKNLSANYLLIGSIALILFYCILSISGFTLSRTSARVLFFIGILGPILMSVTFYNSSSSEFISKFNAFMLSTNHVDDAYNKVIASGYKNGVDISKSVWLESLRALPIGFLCYLGFTYSVYVGGEVEKPEKSQVKGILSALLVGLGFFLICMSLYVQVVGQEFNASIGNGVVLGEVGLNTAPLNFLAGIISGNKWVNIIMQVGNLIWFLLIPYVMLQVCIRNVIAWTCDDLLPSAFLKRTSKSNSPWLATIVLSGAVVAICLIMYYFGVSIIGVIALAAIAYFFTSLAAIRLPKKNPAAFARLPKSAKNSFLGFGSNFQILGFVCLAGFFWILYASIFYPEISGGDSYKAFMWVGGVYFGGILFYQWRKAILKKRDDKANIDWDELFKEIPED